MKSRLRRKHKTGLQIYSGGGILQRRILKKEVRRCRRQMDKIVLKEALEG